MVTAVGSVFLSLVLRSVNNMYAICFSVVMCMYQIYQHYKNVNLHQSFSLRYTQLITSIHTHSNLRITMVVVGNSTNNLDRLAMSCVHMCLVQPPSSSVAKLAGISSRVDIGSCSSLELDWL